MNASFGCTVGNGPYSSSTVTKTAIRELTFATLWRHKMSCRASVWLVHIRRREVTTAVLLTGAVVVLLLVVSLFLGSDGTSKRICEDGLRWRSDRPDIERLCSRQP